MRNVFVVAAAASVAAAACLFATWVANSAKRILTHILANSAASIGQGAARRVRNSPIGKAKQNKRLGRNVRA